MESSHDTDGTRRNLLSRPGPALVNELGRALAATAGAFPIPAAHRRDLPYAVRDLSRLLTRERSELARSYWSAPRFLAAYLHYFLPWNLYRMGWLLPGLDLRLQPGATILDLGSGPLTLPLALWCARPELRSRPLSFICSDVAVKPMEIGLAIFKRLAGAASPWRITLQRAPLEKALARPGKSDGPGGADCIMAGNMLNELSTSRNTTLEQRLEQLMGQAAGRLVPGGRLLLVEPGTRLGGKLIALARKGALHQGLVPLAPCTHSSPCPMLGQASRQSAASSYTGWCHFFHPSDGVPASLARLAKEARLEKDSLAVSCLLLRGAGGETVAEPVPVGDDDDSRPGADGHWGAEGLDDLEALYAEIMEQDEADGAGQGHPAALRDAAGGREDCGKPVSPGRAANLELRVISDLIRLPEEAEPGRYACCERGLALLLDAVTVPSGAFVAAPCPEKEERDAKTGALLLRRGRGQAETGEGAVVRDAARHERESAVRGKGKRDSPPALIRTVPGKRGSREHAQTEGTRKASFTGRKGDTQASRKHPFVKKER